MENFKNSIVMVCMLFFLVVLESFVMANQTVPVIILKLCGLIFWVAKCMGVFAVILALLKDCKNFIESRY